VSTLGDGVIVRSSGGAVTSGIDHHDADDKLEAADTNSDDASDTAAPGIPQKHVEIEITTSPAARAAADTAPLRPSMAIEAAAGNDRDTRQIATNDAPNGPDDMLVSGVQLRSPGTKTAADGFTATTLKPIAPVTFTAPPRAAAIAPDVVADLLTGPAAFIRTAVDLFDVALAPLLAPGPTAPPESPLLWALLGWVRRQFDQGSPASTAAITPVQTIQTEEVTTFAAVETAAASGLPAEFERTVLVSGLDQPVDFRFLPDDMGILIAEKDGPIKLYHDGRVETVITLATSTSGERGIGGIEVDPDFATNHYIYVSYTTVNGAGTNINRLSRLTLSDDLHSVETERVILEFSEPNPIHHGGTIRFGPVDHMLYWSTGENNYAPNAQDLSNLHGKIIRIDPVTLEAAAGNPFLNTPGARPEIYAYGFRNPFRFTFTPEGELLVGDVGSADWEELNLVTPGANYGWPLAEGYCAGCSFVNPIYAYPHTPLPARAGAITSVLYYTGDAFGAEYQNRVFIADYTQGWIKVLTFDEDFTSLIDKATFDDQAGTAVQLLEGPDGNIYQLNIYPGELSVIAPSGGNRAPQAVITATPDNGYADLAVQFSGADSSDPEGSALTYAWDFGIDGGGDASTDVAPTWTYTQNGSYVVTLTVTDAEGKAGQTTHQIVVGSTPPTIDEIAVSQTTYNAGDTITFSASASDRDPADSALDYNWTVVFHHAEHIHPFADDIAGTGGSVTIPRDSHNVDTTWYRIALTVTDSSGLSTTKSIDVYPNLVELEFGSNNPDAVYTIDGVPHTGTYNETAVVGVERVIGSVSPQYVNGTLFVFGSWSDGNLPTHTIVTPATATTYVVTYDAYVAPKSPDPWSIPTQIYLSQRANAQRLASALTTSAGILANAAADVPAGLLNAVEGAGANPLRIPAIAGDLVNGFVGVTALAAAPVMNAVTDVIAAETIRSVGVAAALVSNAIPLTVTVLTAPVEITITLVDTALALWGAVIHPDPLAFQGALDLGQLRLDEDLAEQQGLILGALANLFDDVAAAYAVPLPPPAESGASASGGPLSPITGSLERTLIITNQVVTSTLSIVGTTVTGQVRVANTTINGLQVLNAANPRGELILDWVALTLAKVVREATQSRLVVAETIEKAGEDLATAAQG
jgi:glucose/arabinose dehydrogenase/PKD repeat protein